MLKVQEHYHYTAFPPHQTTEGNLQLTPEQWASIEPNCITKTINNSEVPCFSIQKKDNHSLYCETNYYIGVDWIVTHKLPLYVYPKLNDQTPTQKREINYLRMLFETLEETTATKHIDRLLTVDFKAPLITIDQQQDMLTPFLLIQFLQLTKSIVKKGLKKTYQPITAHLNAKIKGKLLIHRTLKANAHHPAQTTCQYTTLTINNNENKQLKHAYRLCLELLPNYQTLFANAHFLSQLKQLTQFIAPAFEGISDEPAPPTKTTTTPLYKEYTQALQLAKLLTQKHAYTITQRTAHRPHLKTHPFWIDMSKLFELYLYRKLKKAIPNANIYFQKKLDHYTPDYLVDGTDLNGNPIKLIIDAKYTNKYKDEKIRQSDIRQLCGYARQTAVYQALQIEDKTHIIDCLILYADQNAKEDISLHDIQEATPEPAYINFKKLGIKLPEITY